MNAEPNCRIGLLLGDLHIGSAFALWPEGMRTSSGQLPFLNEGQRYLLDCYTHLLSSLPRELDFVIFNGDVAEGQNRCEDARYLTDPDPVWQKRAAVELLRPLLERVPSGQVYVTRGSRYHTEAGSRLDEEIAEALGAVRDSHGRFSRPWLLLRIAGVSFSVHHHTSFTMRYRSMPLEREIGMAAEYCGKAQERMADVYVVSHTHSGFKLWCEGDKLMAIQLPCLKLQDVYAQMSAVPWRWRPEHLGAVLVRVYEQPWRGFRVHAEPLLYAHPLLDWEEVSGETDAEFLNEQLAGEAA